MPGILALPLRIPFVRRAVRAVAVWLRLDIYARRSWSQEGEDLVLSRILEAETDCPRSYVDVGAHHPKRFSNTYFFYRLGWCGIAIEPNPELSQLFAQMRPRDIVVTCGVASKAGELSFIRFNEPALNTFDEGVAARWVGFKGYHIIERKLVRVKPLSDILHGQDKLSKGIGILNVDVEGLDLEVLRGLDWNAYRPRFVLVESLASSLSTIDTCPIYQFLREKDYELIARTKMTFFYRDSRISHVPPLATG